MSLVDTVGPVLISRGSETSCSIADGESSDTNSWAVSKPNAHHQGKLELKQLKVAQPAAPRAPQAKPPPAQKKTILLKARKKETMKRNRRTAAFHNSGVEYPTCQNSIRRWILKKKGRMTGTLVTRYFHIDEGHFVYYSSPDSSSAIGRINFLGAKIKVKSITMLEIECRLAQIQYTLMALVPLVQCASKKS